MKAYEVRNIESGEVVWTTNNLPAAYRRADKLGAGYTVTFNYEVNK